MKRTGRNLRRRLRGISRLTDRLSRARHFRGTACTRHSFTDLCAKRLCFIDCATESTAFTMPCVGSESFTGGRCSCRTPFSIAATGRLRYVKAKPNLFGLCRMQSLKRQFDVCDRRGQRLFAGYAGEGKRGEKFDFWPELCGSVRHGDPDPEFSGGGFACCCGSGCPDRSDALCDESLSR